MNKGNIWAGCAIFGVVLGFILERYMGSTGWAVGPLLGVGTAFFVTSRSKK